MQPMPRSWYDYHANGLPEGASEEEIARREFNLRILAERKPYFMRYIYPSLMKEYRDYIKSVETKCVREFRMSLSELLAIPGEEMTEEQRAFEQYYQHRLPVSNHNCVMNRICRRIEQEFDGKLKAWCEEPFDYTIMKSGDEYTQKQFYQCKAIYEAHNEWLIEEVKRSKRERMPTEDESLALDEQWFRQKCLEVCNSGRVLCDILLDLCYQRSGTKEFAWDVAGYFIIANLIRRNGGRIFYPVRDAEGDIEYAGLRFSMAAADIDYDRQEEVHIDGDCTEREGMGEESD